MASVHESRIRLLAGDLDGEEDEKFLSSVQVEQLVFERTFYDEADDARFPLFVVVADFLLTLSAYHADSAPERRTAALALRQEMLKRHGDNPIYLDPNLAVPLPPSTFQAIVDAVLAVTGPGQGEGGTLNAEQIVILLNLHFGNDNWRTQLTVDDIIALLDARLTPIWQTGGGGGTPGEGGVDADARLLAQQALDAANQAQTTADENKVWLEVYSTLSAQARESVDLGQYTIHNGRTWIVHQTTQARENTPGSGVNDGWRAIDGQYRGFATTNSRYYDAGDHVVISGTLYFNEVEGNYTAAQIMTSSNWSGGPIVDQDARDMATAAQTTIDEHIAAHPTGEASGRTEVLVPFRPGSDQTKILMESTGYVVNGNYTRYGTPHYVSADGSYTVSVDDAQDFANEPNIVALLAGGEASAPITAFPDEPTMEGLTGIYRDDNVISTVSSRPSSIINLHFIQNVGGSRFWNPDGRVARFPTGGASTPDFNSEHQWIAGIGILAIGDEKRIELITDGDQPGGTLRVRFGQQGEFVEHLVVPLVADPNTYHSGLVSDIPDGQDLEFSITNNGNIRTLHAGLHFERFILEEEYERRLTPITGRVAELEEGRDGFTHVSLTQAEYDALTPVDNTIYLVG